MSRATCVGMSMAFSSSMKTFFILCTRHACGRVYSFFFCCARALASTPICYNILQYAKRTKPSADTWAIDPWVRVVPSFLCSSLFQGVCIPLGDAVLLVATWNLLVIFTRHRMPLLGAFSWRTSGSPEPSPARMPSMILWLSPTQDTAVGRDIAHYSFSSIRAVVYGL